MGPGRIISDVLATAVPDLVALQESWAGDQGSQAAGLADRLGLSHAIARADGIVSTPNAALSRWPIVATHQATSQAATTSQARAELLGTDPPGSDHYGVLADLRY